MKNYGKRVYVAMSGGVDSSVAALLLKQKGYDVVGVFMKYWTDNGAPSFAEASAGRENRCCSLEARHDAQRVCAQLGVSFLTWDFQREFKKAVVDEFIKQYKMGLTPNPCVTCNKEIKLGLFIKRALKEGADYIASGHYAKIREANFGERKAKSEKRKTEYKLCQAKDKKKDQSYFLYNLKQEQLAHILFPLGNLIKDKVRKIAQKAGLSVALKKDSQEVCFVKDGDLKKFLSEKIKTRKGDVMLNGGSPPHLISAQGKQNKNNYSGYIKKNYLKRNFRCGGKKIGEHQGVEFYTIGQRAPVGGTGPYFVIAKNIKKNQLIVARGNDKNVLIREFAVKDVNWVSGRAPMPTGRQAKMPFECQVKTRYQQQSQKAVIKKLQTPIRQLADKLQILFSKPQRGVAPGQSAVFYSGKEIIGGGIII